MHKKEELKLLAIGIILILAVVITILLLQSRKISISASMNNPASLSLSPSIGNFKVGETQSVKVIVDGQHLSVSGVDAVIRYDSNQIKIVDSNVAREGTQIQPGDIFTSYYENNVSEEDGIINISGASSSPVTINNPREFAVISFIPLHAIDSAKIEFEYHKGKTNDSNVYQHLSSGSDQDVLFGVLGADYSFAN